MSLALPLIPVWVWSATETWSATLWTVFPLGWGLGLALHLLNQSPDVPADREAGVRGLAQRLGARDARTAGLLVFALVAAAVCVELAFLSPARALAAATVAGGALALSPVATRWFGRDGLFGDVAVASAAIALLLLSAA
jgi:4-hydroxybenzoate polyprenyltransferase